MKITSVQIGVILIAIGLLVAISGQFLSVAVYQKNPSLCVGAIVDNVAWMLGATEWTKIKTLTTCDNLAGGKVKLEISRRQVQGTAGEVYYSHESSSLANDLSNYCKKGSSINTMFTTAQFDKVGDWFFKYYLYDKSGKLVLNEYKTVTITDCKPAVVATCSDGTKDQTCSAKRPQFCSRPDQKTTITGGLTPKASVCGCETGYKPATSGLDQCVVNPTSAQTPTTPSTPEVVNPETPVQPAVQPEQPTEIVTITANQTAIGQETIGSTETESSTQKALNSGSTCEWYEITCKSQNEQTAIYISLGLIIVGLLIAIFGKKLMRMK